MLGKQSFMVDIEFDDLDGQHHKLTVLVEKRERPAGPRSKEVILEMVLMDRRTGQIKMRHQLDRQKLRKRSGRVVPKAKLGTTWTKK